MDKVKVWMDKFGDRYTKRNFYSPSELDSLYEKRYGTTRTSLNKQFLPKLHVEAKILEAGANAGNQLMLLKEMGFKNLYGMEVNKQAIKAGISRGGDIEFINAAAQQMPFTDNFFNMVFTSGLLIHIHPDRMKDVMLEMVRCSKKYIWCFEYYEKEYAEIEYQGTKQLLWKADYAKIFLENFDCLELVKEAHIEYLEDENIDSMFLLRKKAR